MKNRTFLTVLISLVALCLVYTIGHLIYTIYAYQHCSIIEFIAKELW